MEIAVNYDYRERDMLELFDVEGLAMFVIRSEGNPDDTEVSINFVTDETIHELNREYRGIDRPTDVLSFECDGYEDDVAPLVEGMGFELGDIVIAPDVAERQAPEYGMTFADEMSLLVVHGLLHLCGYDHLEEDEALVMEARECELLSAFYGRPFERSGIEAS
ncbi:MAG: rRNA maturation RNase YbeY [Eggerthellaceae bacterium]|nr:rRNA maturation RNase YbeY [Eggerthellaceae bacterium]